MEAIVLDFLDYLAERGLSLHTIQAYGTDVRKCLAALPEGFSKEDLMEYFVQLRKKGYASSSLCRICISLRIFFQFMKKEGYSTTEYPFLYETPKVWQLIPEVLTTEEVQQLLHGVKGPSRLDVRNSALLELLYATGMRVSEVCALLWSDLSETQVRVRGKGNKERVIPLLPSIYDALMTYAKQWGLEKEHTPIFLTHRKKSIDRMTVWNIVKRASKQAGLQKSVSPHTLRHSFATHLLESGADLSVISDLLGHADVGTTDRYTQISKRHIQQAFNTFHPRNT